MRSAIQRAFFGVTVWALVSAKTGAAQVNVMPTVPEAADAADVDEVEDVVPDHEYLPQPDASDELALYPGKVEAIETSQSEELSESPEEIRARHDYGLAAAFGAARPWQFYSLEATTRVNEAMSAGIFAGGGKLTTSGILEDRAFDLSMATRSFGTSARFHFQRLEKASIELIAGYAAWEGTVTPHGATDGGVSSDAADKLSASFRAHGPFGAVAGALTWLWEEGYFLEWTMVGAQRSRIMTRDLSREASLVDKALELTIENPSFYGLTNIKFGYLF